MQNPRKLWPRARKLAQLYNEVNITKTQELYDAANNAANAFDMEIRSFGIEDWKAFLGGRTRRDNINMEILHGIRTLVQLIATNVSLDKICF